MPASCCSGMFCAVLLTPISKGQMHTLTLCPEVHPTFLLTLSLPPGNGQSREEIIGAIKALLHCWFLRNVICASARAVSVNDKMPAARFMKGN